MNSLNDSNWLITNDDYQVTEQVIISPSKKQQWPGRGKQKAIEPSRGTRQRYTRK